MYPLPTLPLRYHVRSLLLLTLLAMTAMLLLTYLTLGELNLIHVGLVLVVGGPVGLLLSVLEVYVAPRLLPHWPLGLRLLLNTGLHLLLFGLLLGLGQHLIRGLQASVTLPTATARQVPYELARLGLLPGSAPAMVHLSLTRLLVVYGLLAFGLTASYQLSRKLGRHQLLRVVLGQYSQPVVEERLFLFVDVKDSTGLAERLGNLRYSAFIRDFFADVGRPIAASGGEVYQYVGDEVVVTWLWPAGLRRANCLRCFFAMQRAVNRRRAYYQAHYGVVPEFKAGLHGGPVVATQVGEIKTELVFHGDVLNTTARIQAQCNGLGSHFLASATVLDALGPHSRYQVHPLGAVALRGKEKPVRLLDVQQTEAIRQ